MSERRRIGRAGSVCLVVGIAVLLLGVILSFYAYQIVYALTGTALSSGVVEGAALLLTTIFGFIQGAAVPLGSTLIGAGIVLRVLAPRQSADVALDALIAADAEDFRPNG